MTGSSDGLRCNVWPLLPTGDVLIEGFGVVAYGRRHTGIVVVIHGCVSGGGGKANGVRV